MTRWIFPSRSLPALAICAVLMTAVLGMYAEDRVEISGVRFTTQRPPNDSPNNWFEMDVELNARPSTNRADGLTSGIKVVAMMAFEKLAMGNGRSWEFFRSSAELVGLPAGRAHLRFYLPPEIVRRDGVAGVPRYWEVTLNGEGLTEGSAPNLRSPALNDEIVHRSFLERVAAEAARNDGVMRPQYLTPFATAYPRSTPTCIWSEAWR